MKAGLGQERTIKIGLKWIEEGTKEMPLRGTEEENANAPITARKERRKIKKDEKI